MKRLRNKQRRRSSAKIGEKLFKEEKKVIKELKKEIKNEKVGRRSTMLPQRVCPYYETLANPFSPVKAHIPDTCVTPSGLATSHINYTTTLAAVGTNTSIHAGGMLMFPFVYQCFIPLVEQVGGAGTISDLNAAGTATTGFQSCPNAGAIIGSNANSSATIRCVSMGMRVTYEGTELNRSGKYYIGIIPITAPASSVASTGTKLSALSTLVGGGLSGTYTTNVGSLREACTEVLDMRACDETIQCIWKPACPVSYQSANVAGTSVLTTTAGAVVFDSVFSCAPGQAGSQFGQNALAFFFEGDTTTSSQLACNPFSFNCVWNWEVVPNEWDLVSYSPGYSISDSRELDECLNKLHSLRIAGIVPKAGPNQARLSGRNFR